MDHHERKDQVESFGVYLGDDSTKSLSRGPR